MKCISTLVLALALSIPLRAQIIERVLVKVNGDIFTQTELEERQTAAIRARMGVDLKPETVNNSEELKKAVDEVTPQLLVDAIDELLLLQMGKEKGYHLSDEQFKAWLDNLRKEQNLGDDQKFQAALKQEGMTIDDLRKNVEKQFLVSNVQRDEVGSKLSITEEEARQYYLTHRERVCRAGDRHASRDSHRGAADDQGRPERRSASRRQDEAESQAAALRTRVLAGEDFAKVAAEASASSVESQRRPDRPDQSRGSVRVAPGIDREDEAGRNHRADPDEPRRADSEARDDQAGLDPAIRERARPRRRQSARRAAADRGAQVPGAHAGAGTHRVEE